MVEDNIVKDIALADFTVLLSVYNKELPLYLSQALDSIWYKQSLKPRQIVLVKDGPLTPELNAEIEGWCDRLGTVMTCVTLPSNVGLASALNIGLEYCNFDLVARMDTDDVSLPDRFNLQIAFMNANVDVAVSSGLIEEWNTDFSSQMSIRRLPLTHNDIVNFAKLRSPISHPAAIFRKSVILGVGGYYNIYPEDHLLWVRVIQSGYKLANIPNVLLRMRTGEAFITRRGFTFLKGELISYRLMYKSSFINFGELIKASFLRAVVRLSPDFIKLFMYKKMR